MNAYILFFFLAFPSSAHAWGWCWCSVQGRQGRATFIADKSWEGSAKGCEGVLLVLIFLPPYQPSWWWTSHNSGSQAPKNRYIPLLLNGYLYLLGVIASLRYLNSLHHRHQQSLHLVSQKLFGNLPNLCSYLRLISLPPYIKKNPCIFIYRHIDIVCKYQNIYVIYCFFGWYFHWLCDNNQPWEPSNIPPTYIKTQSWSGYFLCSICCCASLQGLNHKHGPHQVHIENYIGKMWFWETSWGLKFSWLWGRFCGQLYGKRIYRLI